jgi:hypothetical protein
MKCAWRDFITTVKCAWRDFIATKARQNLALIHEAHSFLF